MNGKTPKKEIKYRITVRDTQDLGQPEEELRGVSGMTPYGLSQSKFRAATKAPKPHADVKLELPDTWGYPFRYDRFKEVFENAKWQPIGSDVRDPRVAESKSIGLLMHNLHRLNSRKYPASFYNVRNPNSGRGLSVFQTLQNVRILFDYWGNTIERAECINAAAASRGAKIEGLPPEAVEHYGAAFSWGAYWAKGDGWRLIYTIRVPRNLENYLVPILDPQSIKVNAQGKTRVRTPSEDQSHIRNWGKSLAKATANLDLHTGNIFEEQRRIHSLVAILEHYRAAVGLVSPAERHIAKEAMSLITDAREMIFRDYEKVVSHRPARVMVQEDIEKLEHLLTQDEPVAESLYRVLSKQRGFDQLLHVVYQQATVALRALSFYPALSNLDPSAALDDAAAATTRLLAGVYPVVTTDHGGSPLRVLAAYRAELPESSPPEGEAGAMGYVKSVVTKVGWVRRVGEFARSLIVLSLGRRFIKELKVAPVIEWGHAAPDFRYKMLNYVPEFKDASNWALAANRRAIIKAKFPQVGDVFEVAVEKYRTTVLAEAQELDRRAQKGLDVAGKNLNYSVTSLDAFKASTTNYMKTVEKFDNLIHECAKLKDSKGADISNAKRVQNVRKMVTAYRREFNILANMAAEQRGGFITRWKRVEPTLFYVGSAVSFFGSMHDGLSHLDSDDIYLKAIGALELINAVSVADSTIDHAVRTKLAKDTAASARMSMLFYSSNAAVPGHVGAMASRALPIVSWGSGGMVDALLCYHYASKEPPENIKAFAHLLGAVGGFTMFLTELGVIGLSGAAVGPVFIIGGIGVSVVELLHGLYDSTHLSGYSKALRSVLKDGGTEAGYYFRRFASAELRRKFELIHRQVGQIEKRDPTDGAKRWLRTCDVDHNLWPLLMNVEPVPWDDPHFT
ncbi:MAG: hypothetical protein AAF715_30495 [Myxococcota bacterium]